MFILPLTCDPSLPSPPNLEILDDDDHQEKQTNPGISGHPSIRDFILLFLVVLMCILLLYPLFLIIPLFLLRSHLIAAPDAN